MILLPGKTGFFDMPLLLILPPIAPPPTFGRSSMMGL
jgi:hypothetical protein